jgi:uncharacterized membrane protein
MSILHPHRHHPPERAYRNARAVARVVDENIRTMLDLHRTDERAKSHQDRAADALTALSGSMLFVYLHTVWFGAWIVLNLGWLGITPFDPFPFGLLTLIVSLEAIFLSTFVLISQNRAGAVADKRADLDLQIDLLGEHEITRILAMVASIADHLGIETANAPELKELERDTTPKELLDEIRAQEQSDRESE